MGGFKRRGASFSHRDAIIGKKLLEATGVSPISDFPNTAKGFNETFT
jgi:hypothetical protein